MIILLVSACVYFYLWLSLEGMFIEVCGWEVVAQSQELLLISENDMLRHIDILALSSIWVVPRMRNCVLDLQNV